MLLFVLFNIAVAVPLIAAIAYVYGQGAFSAKRAKVAGVVLVVSFVLFAVGLDEGLLTPVVIAAFCAFINVPLLALSRVYFLEAPLSKKACAGWVFAWLFLQSAAGYLVSAWSASSI